MTDMMWLLLKGGIIGVTIAAPVGPIGILCIKRTLEQGKWIGFVSGLGAATADGVYGIIAGLGLTVIIHFLTGISIWLQLIGGVFLLYLGIQMLRAKPAHEAAKASRGKTPLKAYLSTLFLTITNPVTILSFLAIFAGLGITTAEYSGVILALGVFIGSAIWWLLLSIGIASLSRFIGKKLFQGIHYASGIVLITFALAAFFTL